MPHLILECSKNVASSFDGRCTLLCLHTMLADTGLFKIEDIKGRMIEHEVYVLGNDTPDGAFVHLDIRVLSGRADDVKAHLTDAALALLEHHLEQALRTCRCSVTVEVSEIHRESYRKVSSQ